MIPVSVARVRTGLHKAERNAGGGRGVPESRRAHEWIDIGTRIGLENLARMVGVCLARIGRIRAQHLGALSATIAQVVKGSRNAQLAQTVATLHVAEPEIAGGELVVSRDLVRNIAWRESMARNALEREERSKSFGAASVSQPFKRKRDCTEMRILGLAAELSCEGIYRRERSLRAAAPERYDVRIEKTHASAELVHTLVVPALVPRFR